MAQTEEEKKIYKKLWYERNKAEIREKKRLYRRRNKEKVNEYNKEYYYSHIDKMKEYRDKSRAKAKQNKEKKELIDIF